jgi:hypothetical protein
MSLILPALGQPKSLSPSYHGLAHARLRERPFQDDVSLISSLIHLSEHFQIIHYITYICPVNSNMDLFL